VSGTLPAALSGVVASACLAGAALAAAAAAAPAPASSGARSVALILAGIAARTGGLGWRPLGQCGRLEHHDGRLEGRGGDWRLLTAASAATAGGGAVLGRLGRLVRRNHGHGRNGTARRGCVWTGRLADAGFRPVAVGRSA